MVFERVVIPKHHPPETLSHAGSIIPSSNIITRTTKTDKRHSYYATNPSTDSNAYTTTTTTAHQVHRAPSPERREP